MLHSLETRSAVDLKRYSDISEVYWSWLHSLGTRSAVEFLKVFTTSVYAYTHAYTQIRNGGGKSAPPPVGIGLKGFLFFNMIEIGTRAMPTDFAEMFWTLNY